MNINEPNSLSKETLSAIYGKGDATYLAVGGEEGVSLLVDCFYDYMDSEESAQPLRLLHSEDLSESRAKLKAFLSGWMGGPKLYQQQFGSINIPSAHAHLKMDKSHADQWLSCMKLSMIKLSYPEDLIHYLLKQFSFPVQHILQRAELESQKTASHLDV